MQHFGAYGTSTRHSLLLEMCLHIPAALQQALDEKLAISGLLQKVGSVTALQIPL